MWLDKSEFGRCLMNLVRLTLCRQDTYLLQRVPSTGCGECPACVLRNDGLATYLAKNL